MNRLERDALTHRLRTREQLVETLATHLSIVGQLYRQIEEKDKRTVESFSGVIEIPAELTPAGFRAMFDAELAHQIKEGDPAPDSFLASVSAPRQDLTAQCRELHDRILSGDN